MPGFGVVINPHAGQNRRERDRLQRLTAVVGSDGQTYSADFGTVSQCTNFTFGEFQLPTGDTATGCVVFQLPTAVTVASVQFSLDAGYLDTVVWTA